MGRVCPTAQALSRTISYPLKHVVRSPRSQRKARKMTIGIGFQSLSGVVLACDTQVTLQGLYKEHQQKLFLIDKAASGFTIASCYSGMPNLAFAFYKQVEQALIAVEVSSIQQVAETLEVVARDFRRKYPKDMPYQNFLFAVGKDGERPKLLRISNSIVDETESATIGAGDSALVKYLIAKLCPFWPGTESPFFLVVLSAYIVAQAKEFIDGCGGDTSAIIVAQDAGIKIYSGFPMGQFE
jgi:20S proteasome alpha/beta subunit